MKRNKIFRILGLAIILCLLLVAIPAIPAYAAEDITRLTPDEGRIGDSIHIDGDGFIPDTRVYIYFSNYSISVGTDIDDAYAYEPVKAVWTKLDGDLYTNFTVPARLTDGIHPRDVEPGRYYVYVTYLDDIIQARYTFTVIGGEITDIDPDEGPVGTEVTISGEDFAANEDITVEYDGDDVDIESGDTDTDSHGDFDCTILIPPSTEGDHTITVSDESGSEDEATFTVESEITLDPTSGTPGTEVTVTGTGFGDRSDIVTIKFNDTEVDIKSGDDDTDSDGNFESTFTVPAGTAPGDYDVEVEDEDDNSADALFTISLSLTITPTTGNVGTPLTVSGIGFGASMPITITYDGATVATTTSLADGTFTAAPFNAPVSIHGNHNIAATDGTSSITKVFTMESTPPLVPVPVLPEPDTNLKGWKFDWENVTDPSLPITYDLQVATDAGFTNILVDKKGVTESEYTLDKEERPERTEEEAPYYWRVKAVDGASNASGWSAAGSFYVGGISLPTLPWGAIIGICAAAFIPLGIWIGRRTAYTSY